MTSLSSSLRGGFKSLSALFDIMKDNGLITTSIGVTGVAMAADSLYYALTKAARHAAMCRLVFLPKEASWLGAGSDGAGTCLLRKSGGVRRGNTNDTHFASRSYEPSVNASCYIARPEAERYLLKKFCQMSTYSVLFSEPGLGTTTMLKTLAGRKHGILYISCLGVKSVDELCDVMKTELNIVESARMSLIGRILYKFLRLSSDSIPEEITSVSVWREVTSVYEAVADDVTERLQKRARDQAAAAGVSASGATPTTNHNTCPKANNVSLRPPSTFDENRNVILIFDHIDDLDEETTKLIQLWAASCQVKRKMHVVMSCAGGKLQLLENAPVSQEAVNVPQLPYCKVVQYADKRLRQYDPRIREAIVARSGCHFDEIHAAARFLEDDFVPTWNRCEEAGGETSLPNAIEGGTTTSSSADDVQHLNGMLSAIDRHFLFRFWTRTRALHLYVPQRLADDTGMDEKRFYLYLLYLKLEAVNADAVGGFANLLKIVAPMVEELNKTNSREDDGGFTPHEGNEQPIGRSNDHPSYSTPLLAASPISLHFDTIFKICPVRVYRKLVEELTLREALPFRAHFNTLSMRAPIHLKCFLWALGAPGSEKRQEMLNMIILQLCPDSIEEDKEEELDDGDQEGKECFEVHDQRRRRQKLLLRQRISRLCRKEGLDEKMVCPLLDL